MKRTLLGLFILAACSAASSCSKTTDPSGGSQTHFLSSCEASCPDPYQCLCGVCTQPCTNGMSCGEFSEKAECLVPPEGGACAGRASQICDIECAQRSDCAAHGAEFACVDGRCRVAPLVPEAGRDGSSDMAGMSGGGLVGAAGTMAGRSGAGAATGTAGAATGTAGAAIGTAGAGSTMSAALCNGTDEVWLWTGAQGGGPLEPTFKITNPHGHSYLLIDRHCRYYVFGEIMVGTKTGTLTEQEAQKIADEVGYFRLAEWDAHVDDACPDGAVQFISDGDARVYCTCGCDEDAPDGLGNAIRASADWATTLRGRGQDMDGPIGAIASVQATSASPPGPPLEWTLSRQVAAIAGFVQDASAPGMPVRFEGDDATQLRALRTAARERPQSFNHAFVADDTAAYDLFMRDELPPAILASMAEFPDE